MPDSDRTHIQASNASRQHDHIGNMGIGASIADSLWSQDYGLVLCIQLFVLSTSAKK